MQVWLQNYIQFKETNVVSEDSKPDCEGSLEVSFVPLENISPVPMGKC